MGEAQLMQSNIGSAHLLRNPGSPLTGAVFLLASPDGTDLSGLDISGSRFARASVHDQKTPASGLSDGLAEEGYYLFSIDASNSSRQQRVISVELPLFDRVDVFLQCLGGLSQAAMSARLSYLQLAGFPPPVDHGVAWTTVTPDPAVIEINQAPQPDSLHFYRANRELFEVADQLGLSPYRLHYNGKLSDSGGGGQFTLGGRSSQASPFFVAPRLLPRLVRYVNNHPSLSYLFATEYVGGASQSPRCDEGARDRFLELAIALDRLENEENISNELLYLSLAPFLSDASGNTHRSELNIEKLWNTSLPQRGCLGLLEFRAFRMPSTAKRSIAIAMLLRSITAMLVKSDPAPGLVDWQDELHDRFALPFFLRRDLQRVLQDTVQAGFGISTEFQSELLTDPDRARWGFDFAGGELSIEQAIEYWPLVGDVATQESGGSRLVDSSTLRLQIALQAEANNGDQLGEWQLQTCGYLLPLREDSGDNHKLRLTGLRFRDFTPWRGLHPSIRPINPVLLYLSHPRRDLAYQIQLYNWRPDATPYAGLPRDLDEAASRRQERFIVTTIDRDQVPVARSAPDTAMTEYSFDLRCL